MRRHDIFWRPLVPVDYRRHLDRHRLGLVAALALVAHDLPVEFYWIDAEWFGAGPWFLNAGDWRLTLLHHALFSLFCDALLAGAGAIKQKGSLARGTAH